MAGGQRTITVTGATGTLGRPVVDLLLERGDRVRALSRNPPADERPGLQWVIGDLSVGAGMEEAFAGADTVIHCATNPRRPQQDVAGTHNLIGTLAAGGTPLTYISIVGVDRIPLGYYRVKLEVEGLIQASGLPWGILRATQFHDLAAGVLGKLGLSPVIPVPAGTSLQPVEVSEVAQRLVEVAEQPGIGRVPDFGGPEILELRELARIWLERRDRKRPVVPVRLPGKAAAAFRAGHQLAPDHREGVRTFAEHLAGGRKRESK